MHQGPPVVDDWVINSKAGRETISLTKVYIFFGTDNYAHRMAIVRCQDHPPRNTNYETAVKPVGYPDTALVCGRNADNHTEPGWVYLRQEEYEEYQEGKRVFTLWGPDSSSIAAKVKVGDETVEVLSNWVSEDDEMDESGTSLQSQSSIDRY